jgi:hypothetical protein
VSAAVKPIDEQTRGEQTRYLSREFIIGFAVQVILTVGGFAYAYGTLAEKVSQVEPEKVALLQQKVAVLEDNQIDAERITRLEESMKNLDKSLLRVQAALDRNFYSEPNPRSN